MNLSELNKEVQSLINTVEEIGCNDYVAEIIHQLADNIGNIAEYRYECKSDAFREADDSLEESKDHAQSILDLIDPSFVVEIGLLEKITSYELTE